MCQPLISSSQMQNGAVGCRPADRTALDEDMQTIGVPSDVPSDTNAQGRYFFAILSSDSAPSTSPSSAGSSTGSIPQVSTGLLST